MYTVASPGPDPDHDLNPRGGGQLPNSTLTSGISGGASPTYNAMYTQFCRIKGCGGAGWPPHQ